MSKVELLAPAGDLEKLQIAFAYGADAVYAGVPEFGMRVKEIGFNLDSLAEGVDYAHKLGKKVFVTVNIFARNRDIEKLPDFLDKLQQIKPDALIVADPGILGIIADKKITMPLHLSTQANVISARSAAWWAEKVKLERIILARELHQTELTEIVQQVPQMEFEAFVHGALCMSYSGRCNISNYLTGRDANQGDCSHCCRWNYRVYLEEPNRPGELMPVEEDDQGSYFFNSRDLCLAGELDKLLATGIKSLKIEGRNKTIYYLARVISIYREALDDLEPDPARYTARIPYYLEELATVTTRGYTTGFFTAAGPQMVQLKLERVPRTREFVGLIKPSDGGELTRIEARNQIKLFDELEILSPTGLQSLEITDFLDETASSVGEVVNTNQVFYIKTDQKFPPNSMIRKKTAHNPDISKTD